MPRTIWMLSALLFLATAGPARSADPAPAGRLQRTGEKLSEELIAALGHADADLPVCAPIELGRAPRAWTLTSTQASIAHLE